MNISFQFPVKYDFPLRVFFTLTPLSAPFSNIRLSRSSQTIWIPRRSIMQTHGLIPNSDGRENIKYTSSETQLVMLCTLCCERATV